MSALNSRRSFLGGIATVLAASPAGADVASVQAQPVSATAEVPELLELGERLAVLASQFEAAITRKDEAVALYERLRPAYPPEIITRDDYNRAEAVRDLFGKTVMWDFAPHDRRPLLLYRPHLVQASIIGGQISRHTKEGKALRRIVRVARQFERQEEAARAVSEVDRRIAEIPDTEVCRLVDKIMALQPTSLAGVMIQARAARLSYRAMNWQRRSARGPADYVVEALLRVEATQAV